MVPWDELDDDLKQANLAQARDALTKVARVGAVVCPGPDPAGFVFTNEEVDDLPGSSTSGGPDNAGPTAGCMARYATTSASTTRI